MVIVSYYVREQKKTKKRTSDELLEKRGKLIYRRRSLEIFHGCMDDILTVALIRIGSHAFILVAKLISE